MTTQPVTPTPISVDEYLDRLVAAAPAPTAEQKDFLRAIFAPVVAELTAEQQDRKTA